MMYPGQQRRGKPRERRNPFPEAKTPEEKIRQILHAKKAEGIQDDIRRAQVYLLMDLFYRGYQNVGAWDWGRMAWPTYDAEPMDYLENRFRRNVLINAGNMIRMEQVPVIRPASGNPNDIEAANTAQDAWEKAQDEIGYDQLLSDKAIQKSLFGTTFIYSGYRYGNTEKIMVPKWKTESVEIPGAAICPQCRMTAEMGTPECPECLAPMDQMPPMTMQDQVQNGFDMKERGCLFSTAFSPLEVKIRPSVRGGPTEWPYVVRNFREDLERLEWIFPDLDIDKLRSGGSNVGAEASVRYQQIAANQPGNVWGNSVPFWTTEAYFTNADVTMGWIHPLTYRGDKQLEKEAPDGLMATMIGDEVAEYKPEKITDVWTYEVYYPNTHSAYGDGMFDDIPVQRMINAVGQLTYRHFEYDTIPLRLYDSSMMAEKDVTNDPKQKWIPVSPATDKKVSDSVYDLAAQQLSFDVNVLRTDLRQVDQDISGATDPLAGQIAGANTPYSAQILAVEQGQTRFLPSTKYNKVAKRDHVRQVLNLAKTHWTDPRTLAEIDENTGKTTWKQFVGADIGRGNWTVYIMESDFKPRTRGEQMQALDTAKNYGIDILGSPKLRLQFFEKIGLTPDGDTLSTQARRAARQIEKIIQGMPQGIIVTPDEIVDDGLIQWPLIQEYLASPQGETVQEQNPDAYEAIKQYGITVLQIAMIRQSVMGGMGMDPGMGGPPQQPGESAPGGTRAGPQQPKQEFGQSPVPQDQKQPTPPNPARAEQKAGVI